MVNNWLLFREIKIVPNSEATNEKLNGFYIIHVLTMNFLFQLYPCINSHISMGIVSITILVFSGYSPQWLSIT